MQRRRIFRCHPPRRRNTSWAAVRRVRFPGVCALLVLVGSAFSSSVAVATSTLSIGPLADVNEVVVQVMVGDSLALESEQSSRLFEGGQGFDQLKAAIITRVEHCLEAGGVRVTENAATVLDVSIFGGKFAESGSNANFFLLEVSVCHPGAASCTPDRSVLGFASDKQLESKLGEAAEVVVRGFLEERARYRATRR